MRKIDTLVEQRLALCKEYSELMAIQLAVGAKIQRSISVVANHNLREISIETTDSPLTHLVISDRTEPGHTSLGRVTGQWRGDSFRLTILHDGFVFGRPLNDTCPLHPGRESGAMPDTLEKSNATLREFLAELTRVFDDLLAEGQSSTPDPAPAAEPVPDRAARAEEVRAEKAAHKARIAGAQPEDAEPSREAGPDAREGDEQA